MAYDAATQAALSGGFGGYGGGYGGMDTTGLTEDQIQQAQQKRRQLMYAQGLMNAGSSGTPTSFMGGFMQNVKPGVGSWLQQNALTNRPTPPPVQVTPQFGGLY